MSQIQKCRKFKNVANSKMSQIQKCPKFKNIPNSKMSQLASFKVATIFTKEQFSEMIFKREVPEELADAVLQWNT